MTARDEWKAHWPVVLASLVGMGVASAHVYSIGALISPLEDEFGWTRAQISSGMTAATVIAVLFSPFVGIFIDKVGPRRIALPGVLVFLAAMALISTANGSIWQWIAIWLFIATGALAIKPTIWTVAISGLFVKSRGLALAVMLCGTGLMSSGLPFLTTKLIDLYGWRTAIQITPALLALISFPLLYFFLTSAADIRRRTPAKAAEEVATVAPELVGLGVREAMLSWRFAKIVVAALLFTVAALAIIVNVIPILVSTGIDRSEAAAIAGLVGVTSIVGRLSTGVLLDRLNGNIIGCICVILPVAACLCLALAPGSIPMAIAGIMIIGLSIGAELDVIAFLTAKHFGTARYGTIFGTIAGVWSLASGVGPLIANYIFDVTRSYELALWGAIPLFVIASLALFTLGAFPDFNSKSEPARD